MLLIRSNWRLKQFSENRKCKKKKNRDLKNKPWIVHEKLRPQSKYASSSNMLISGRSQQQGLSYSALACVLASKQHLVIGEAAAGQVQAFHCCMSWLSHGDLYKAMDALVLTSFIIRSLICFSYLWTLSRNRNITSNVFKKCKQVEIMGMSPSWWSHCP